MQTVIRPRCIHDMKRRKEEQLSRWLNTQVRGSQKESGCDAPEALLADGRHRARSPESGLPPSEAVCPGTKQCEKWRVGGLRTAGDSRRIWSEIGGLRIGNPRAIEEIRR